MSTGNTQTVALCYEHSIESTRLVQMGACHAPVSESKKKLNYITEKELHLVKEICSLPYELDFNLPVVKVSCGNAFAALVTAEGDVHTWGSNRYGELGIDSSSILLSLFPDKYKPLKFSEKEKIIDVQTCFNSAIALSDEGRVWVWGRRRGQYPAFDLTLLGVQNMVN